MSKYNYDRPDQSQVYRPKTKMNTTKEDAFLVRFIMRIAPYFGGLGKRWLESTVKRSELENKKLEAETRAYDAQALESYSNAVKNRAEAEATREMKEIAEQSEKIEDNMLLNEPVEPTSLDDLGPDLEQLREEIRVLELKYGLKITARASEDGTDKNIEPVIDLTQVGSIDLKDSAKELLSKVKDNPGFAKSILSELSKAGLVPASKAEIDYNKIIGDMLDGENQT